MTDHPTIPVREAIEALEYAIKVCDSVTPGKWFSVDQGSKTGPMMVVMAERIAGKGPSHEVAICATGDSSQEMEDANAAFIVHARACYRGALEYLLDDLLQIESDNRRDIAEGQEGRPLEFGSAEYAAVAPIWRRWKEEVKR